jgi:hypothetical protein
MKIEIIARPPGQAPEWVRDAWIGIKLPVSEEQPGLDATLRGVVDLENTSENANGYAVDGFEAFDLLKKHNSDAALWWQENAATALLGKLVFKRDVCKEI